MTNLNEHMEDLIKTEGTLLNEIVMSQLEKGINLEDYTITYGNQKEINSNQALIVRVDIENENGEERFAYVGVDSQGNIFKPTHTEE